MAQTENFSSEKGHSGRVKIDIWLHFRLVYFLDSNRTPTLNSHLAGCGKRKAGIQKNHLGF